MKMWSMNVMILLLFCYACLSTGNGRVYFASRNFYNVLHWDPVAPAFPGEKVLYSVQHRSDAKDQPFQIKVECQNITDLSCDLTAETPSVYDVYYQAKVYVNGQLHGRTHRFKPLADTVFGPPILSTSTTMSSLYVKVTLPSGPNGVPVEDIITHSKNGPHRTILLYTLIMTRPEWAEQEIKSLTGQFILNLKNNQTEHCGYVVYKLSTEWGRSGSEKASFCVKLQDNPWIFLRWLLLSVIILAALFVLSAVCMYKYVKGGKPKDIPQALQEPTRGTCRVQQFPDKNLILSKPEVCKSESDQTVYVTIQAAPKVSSVGLGGYSPQDIPFHSWQSSTGSSVDTGAHSATLNPVDTSAQSSEIYSAVAAHVPAEEDEDCQQASTEHRETSHPPLCPSGESWDKGGMSPKLTSCGLPPLPDADDCESNPAGQLLLHTVRDTNGQLMLPSLTFPLQSRTGDTPMNPERKPLLSDLIDSKDGPSLVSLQCLDSSDWSDSGCDDSTVNTPTQPYCNGHYSPSQPVVPYFHQGFQRTLSSDATFESSYKQNWMPEILHGRVAMDSCEYRRTNCPWTWTAPEMEEEGEEDEGRGVEEDSRPILLGNWTVQIQE